MTLHEEKYCPGCGVKFECKPGNISQCQCFPVTLTQEETDYILSSGYVDCLCANCILILKEKLAQENE